MSKTFSDAEEQTTTPAALPPIGGDGAALEPQAQTRHGLSRTFASLGIRDYRVLWLGLIGMWLGLQFQQVARGYLAYKLTGSALALGLVLLSVGIPRILFSLVGGALADRMPKRDLLLITMAGLVIGPVVTGILVQTGVITIWELIAIGVFQGTLFTFSLPVRQAFIPELVGQERLANAISLNSAGMTATRVIGPAIGGLLISVPWVGISGTFYLVGVAYLWLLWFTARISKRGMPLNRRRRSMGADIRAGLGYIRRQHALLILLTLGFIPVALGMPYQSLMPVFAVSVLHSGATGLGFLLAASGVGAVLGTLLVATLSDSPHKATLQLVMGLVFGVSLVAFAFVAAWGSFIFALATLVVAGLSGDAYLALNSTLIMTHTDAALYGRVQSVYFLTQSVRPLAVLPLGAIVDAIGAPLTQGIAGAALTVFVLALVLSYPQYRQIG
jgi:MFS family permease